MWISNREAPQVIADPAADLGQVTLPGTPAGVLLAGERRNVPVIAPGGYHWTPEAGDTVLVLKSGVEQAPCVAGKAEKSPSPAVAPGEVFLSVADGAGILLQKDGGLVLTGRVKITGALTVEGTVVMGDTVSLNGKVTANGAALPQTTGGA